MRGFNHEASRIGKSDLGDEAGLLDAVLARGFVLLAGASARARRTEKLARLIDRKSTRLNSSHIQKSRMPSSA